MVKRGRGRPRKNPPQLPNSPTTTHEKGISNGAASTEANLPEFFQIYLPELCSDKLLIPPDFIKNFGGKVPITVSLQTQSGRCWKVYTTKISQHYFFQKGWPEFVQENSLADKDFLTFCYVGNSIFNVQVFTINGCVKTTIGTKNLQENVASEPEVGKDNGCHGADSSLTKTWGTTKSINIADASFTVSLNKHCTDDKGRFTIPSTFCNAFFAKHNPRFSRMVTLRTNKGSWAVNMSYNTDRIQFMGGWSQFIQDNSLKMGNSCTFQLIDKKDLVFDVTFFS